MWSQDQVDHTKQAMEKVINMLALIYFFLAYLSVSDLVAVPDRRQLYGLRFKTFPKFGVRRTGSIVKEG